MMTMRTRHIFIYTCLHEEKHGKYYRCNVLCIYALYVYRCSCGKPMPKIQKTHAKLTGNKVLFTALVLEKKKNEEPNKNHQLGPIFDHFSENYG